MTNTGDRFGRWTVLREGELYFAPSGRYKAKRFVCQCKCGKEKLVRESTLISGESTSCGCYSAELNSIQHTTHGLSKHKLYDVWHDMVRRCTDISRKDYKHYGGRGITICPEWLGQYGIIAFLKDMEESFVDGLELERKDVNGNYCPENCTWVTRQIQVINRRPMYNGFDANFLTFQGKTLCLSQWAEETGIARSILTDRIGKLKWTVEKALTAKIRPKRTVVLYNSKRFLLTEVLKYPPNVYAKAKSAGITAHQYVADILHNKAEVFIEVNRTEHKILSLTDRSAAIKQEMFIVDFWNNFMGVELPQ